MSNENLASSGEHEYTTLNTFLVYHYNFWLLSLTLMLNEQWSPVSLQLPVDNEQRSLISSRLRRGQSLTPANLLIKTSRLLIIKPRHRPERTAFSVEDCIYGQSISLYTLVHLFLICTQAALVPSQPCI